jgi:hypothetical protein
LGVEFGLVAFLLGEPGKVVFLAIPFHVEHLDGKQLGLSAFLLQLGAQVDFAEPALA